MHWLSTGQPDPTVQAHHGPALSEEEAEAGGRLPEGGRVTDLGRAALYRLSLGR